MNNYIFFAVLLSCLINFALGKTGAAEEAATDLRNFKHPLTDIPGPSDDVETSFYFPGHADQKFPVGETVTVLCHFSNDGSHPINVTAIMGSLNSPFDFRHHVQNYTYKPYGIVIKGGEEMTLQYQFTIHPELEPIEYSLAHTVFYESDTEAFATTFFNQTVEAYLPLADYDIETILQLFFSLFVTVAVAGAVLITCFPEHPSVASAQKALFTNISKLSAGAAAAAAHAAASEATSDSADEWIDETPASKHPHKKTNKAGGK